MGADYRYAGSVSYGRLNDEIKGIVELFGGKMISERENYNTNNSFVKPIGYFMEEPLKYKFLENTPKIFEKWCNEPYESLSRKETKELYDFLKTKWEDVEKISDQIAYELKTLVESNCGWYLS